MEDYMDHKQECLCDNAIIEYSATQPITHTYHDVTLETHALLERVMSHFPPHPIIFCVLYNWIKYV